MSWFDLMPRSSCMVVLMVLEFTFSSVILSLFTLGIIAILALKTLLQFQFYFLLTVTWLPLHVYGLPDIVDSVQGHVNYVGGF